MKMNKLMKRTGLAAMLAVGFSISAPAFAATTTNVNVSTVTDAFSERNLINNHLEQARQDILVGKYDSATMHANEARRWFLAFSDSVAMEKPSYNWDNVRDLEGELLETYMDLGRLYHISGNFQNSVNVLAASLSVNPYQPEARYQQMLAYVAMNDADDADIDANDIERFESEIERINRLDDLNNDGIIDAWQELKSDVNNAVDRVNEGINNTIDNVVSPLIDRDGNGIADDLDDSDFDIDQDGISDDVDPMIDRDSDGISDMDDEDIQLDLDLDGDEDVIIDVE
jgi:tetratricopeptide (TPR) repeat protein